MSVEEFDRALALLKGTDASFIDVADTFGLRHVSESSARVRHRMLPERVEYQGHWNADGILEGVARVTVGNSLSFPVEVALGDVVVRQNAVRLGVDSGPAMIAGRPDKTVVLVALQPGVYEFSWKLDLKSISGISFSSATQAIIPLVPSLSSGIQLECHAGMRPHSSGHIWKQVGPPQENQWQLDMTFSKNLRVNLESAEAPFTHSQLPSMALWSDIAISPRGMSMTVQVMPREVWPDAGEIELELPESVIVDSVTMNGWNVSWSRRPSGISILIPSHSCGTQSTLVIDASGPFESDVSPLPLPKLDAASWSASGLRMVLDRSLGLESLELVSAEVIDWNKASWPLAGRAAKQAIDGSSTRIAIETQGANATIKTVIAKLETKLTIAKVITVELLATSVLARALCDVGVERGEVFQLSGRLAPRWIIDSVEVVGSTESPEWKTVREKNETRLDIRFPWGIAPGRPTRLRILGHRAALTLGETFSSDTVDMVQFEGESSKDSIIDLVTSAETAIESDSSQRIFESNGTMSPRLLSLREVTSGSIQLPAGNAASPLSVRLVRRRVPVDVVAHAQMNIRDERLTESFTFDCRVSAGSLDRLIVNVQGITGEGFEWTLLPPTQGRVSARRIELPQRDDIPPGTDSYELTLSPPARGEVSLRGVRVLPMTGSMPVTLAWIDNANTQSGDVVVRHVGQRRPEVLNRRLRELATLSSHPDDGSSVLAEFSFDPIRDVTDADLVAAEIVPIGGADSESRAWAWKERVTTWCFDSGVDEFKIVFDIENHGRQKVVFIRAQDVSVQEVLLDGKPIGAGPRGGAESEISIDMPAEKRHLQLTVLATRPSKASWIGRHIEGVPGGLDLPVLERSWCVFVPPSREVVSWPFLHRIDKESRSDWVARLFAAQWRQEGVVEEKKETIDFESLENVQSPSVLGENSRSGTVFHRSIVEGFQERRFAAITPGLGRIELIDRRLLQGMAIGMGVVAWVVVSWLLMGHGRAAVTLCVTAAIVALWISSPWDSCARAFWWGGMAALFFRMIRTQSRDRQQSCAYPRVLVWIVFGWSSFEGVSNAEEIFVDEISPLRVYVTPGDSGGTALVPESLYSSLTRASRQRVSAVRLLELVVTAEHHLQNVSQDKPWTMTLIFEADAGAILQLDQSISGASWVPGSVRVDAVKIDDAIDFKKSLLEVRAVSAGRHQLLVSCVPHIERIGEASVATLDLPVTPFSRIESGIIQQQRGALDGAVCDRTNANGIIDRAPRLNAAGAMAGAIDLSGASQCIATWAIPPQSTLLERLVAVESHNDIELLEKEIQVLARYEIDAGQQVLWSFDVVADLRLEPQPSQDFSIVRLEPGRFRINLKKAAHGKQLCKIPFACAIDHRVGRFNIPWVWLETALTDSRQSTVTMPPSLKGVLSLPAGASFVPMQDIEGTRVALAWRSVHTRTTQREVFSESEDVLASASHPLHHEPVFLTVTRVPQSVRGTHHAEIDIEASLTRVRLEARLRREPALCEVMLEIPAAFEVENVEWLEDPSGDIEHALQSEIKAIWSRPEKNRLRIVSQQPTSGWCTLRVSGRVMNVPPASGALPLVRVMELADVPLEIDLTSTPDRIVSVSSGNGTVEQLDESTDRCSFVLQPSAQAPGYTLRTAGRDSDIWLIVRADRGRTIAIDVVVEPGNDPFVGGILEVPDWWRDVQCITKGASISKQESMGRPTQLFLRVDEPIVDRTVIRLEGPWAGGPEQKVPLVQWRTARQVRRLLILPTSFGGSEIEWKTSGLLPTTWPEDFGSLEDLPRPGAADQIVRAIRSEYEAVAAPGSGRAASSGTELADIRFGYNERGKAWGVVRWDVIPAATVLRMQFPQGMRPFEVFVDDHPVRSTPTGGNEYQIRLLEAGLPRSIVAIFAGDVPRGLSNGLVQRLSAPTLVGLPARQTIWTLAAPSGFILRVASPSQVVSSDALAIERLLAVERLIDGWTIAMKTRSPGEQERLWNLLQSRFSMAAEPLRAGETSEVARKALSTVETVLKESLRNLGVQEMRDKKPDIVSFVKSPESTWRSATVTLGPLRYVTSDGDGALTLRAARSGDGTTAMRAIASIVVVTVGGFGWCAWRRKVSRWRISEMAAWLSISCAGFGWIWLLTPVLPGWGLILGGIAGFLTHISLSRRMLSSEKNHVSTVLVRGAVLEGLSEK